MLASLGIVLSQKYDPMVSGEKAKNRLSVSNWMTVVSWLATVFKVENMLKVKQSSVDGVETELWFSMPNAYMP